MTDRELLTRFTLSGSREAFSKLVERHAGMVYSTCLRVTGAQDAAEEATQAVFLILSRKAKRLAARATLAGWLYTTAYRVACRARRAAARRRSSELVGQLAEERLLVETSQFAAVD
jgi:DNA-directed RNA polymerase specialized sigma24 family protein